MIPVSLSQLGMLQQSVNQPPTCDGENKQWLLQALRAGVQCFY